MVELDAAGTGRRAAVLESALSTFARNGYRATSMSAVAHDARISRPGLYFLFGSKEAVFREAASHVLAQDLAAVEQLLGDRARPIGDRLVDAYGRWAGRYVGPLARDIPGVVADNPDLVDAVAEGAPARFEALVTTALTPYVGDPDDVAQTLTSVSVGLKHQVQTQEAYLARVRVAVGLLVPGRPR